MSYDTIKDAAMGRAVGESAGAWALADALAAEMPNEHGKRNDLGELSSDVATKLQRIAYDLTADGIETPAGGEYTCASLRDLRLVALGWAPADRHANVAFRTHQEAGTSNAWQRAVLAALSDAASSGAFDQPVDLDVDEEAWQRAVVSIQRKIKAHNRYPVSANDLRIALKRKPNVPDKDKDTSTANAMDAAESMIKAADSLTFAVQVLSREGMHVGDIREVMEGYLERLSAAVEMLRTLLSDGGFSDAELERLTEGSL